MYKYLKEFADKITIDNKYHHKHNDELTFLDVINETNIEAYVKITDLQDYSFNTVEEYNKLKDNIKVKLDLE